MVPPNDLAADAGTTIRVPTLLYAGTNDAPEAEEHAARLMPNAAFVAVEGPDHAQAFERSDLVLPHVRGFLDRANRAPVAGGFADTPWAKKRSS